MPENPDSKDKPLDSLGFIIGILKEHEQNLDKSIGELVTLTEQIGGIEALKGSLEKIDVKINNLKLEVTKLSSCLSNAPKEALPLDTNKQESQPASNPPAEIQGELSLILSCRQWGDFQELAVHARSVAFEYKAFEKVFHVTALKGNKIITYTGVLPNFLSILKVWISRQLEIPDQKVFEGSL
jgi:hypothetical protein